MSRPINPAMKDESGEYLSRKRAWASYTKSGSGERLKVTLYLTKGDRRLLARLAKQENLKAESNTAIVRRALEMALEKG